MRFTVQTKYSYFQNLEKRIKVALAVYLFILITGTLGTSLGLANVVTYVAVSRPEIVLLIGVIVAGVLAGLVMMLRKLQWIDLLHKLLDREFFGFLKKSNETILRSLLLALPSHERDSIHRLKPVEQDAIAQSVFSALSNDAQLFESLMKSGIFTAWSSYWIALYGTLSFALLSLIGFISLIVGSDPQSDVIFSTFWVVAIIHLLLTIVLGFLILRITVKTVAAIVATHRDEIASMIRDNTPAQVEVM